MNAAVRVTSVRLDEGASGAADRPVWVQIARVGRFEGYGGGAFEFTPQTFDTIVDNFRARPSYDGKTDQIPWDFHHSSELPANSGTIPQSGAPAQGWIVELQTRRGADGVVTLWALTRWLEPARAYIKEERYKWSSVSVVLDAIDPVSGRSIGAVLTSVALTNSPFIEGMQQLAASNAPARGNSKPITLKARITSASKPTLDVSLQHGPNPFAKLLAHVKATNPSVSHDDATAQAMALNRSHRIVA